MFVLLSIYSFFGAFRTEKVPKELSIITDERDDLIISKAGKMTIKIMGVLLSSMWLISFGLYALFKHIVLLTVTVTLELYFSGNVFSPAAVQLLLREKELRKRGNTYGNVYRSTIDNTAGCSDVFPLVAVISLIVALLARRKGNVQSAKTFKEVFQSFFIEFLNPLNWL